VVSSSSFWALAVAETHLPKAFFLPPHCAKPAGSSERCFLQVLAALTMVFVSSLEAALALPETHLP
jgi:hypothetical protein